MQNEVTSVSGAASLYAAWTPRIDTTYTVEHYRQDVTGGGYTLHEAAPLTGTTDSTATAAAKTYAGFHELTTHPDRIPSGTIAPDGSLTLALYYDRDLHSVSYQSNGGSDVDTQTGIRYEAAATEPTDPGKQGYDFGGWFADELLTTSYEFSAPVTGDITLYAAWTPRIDTTYTVEHYRQDVAGSGYTLHETEQLTGTTDSTATAAAKVYTGFHELTTHPDRMPSGTVAPDGSLVLALYYDRNLHSVAFDSNGGSEVDSQTGIRYGVAATEPQEPTRQGYDFGGWFADELLTIAYSFSAPVPGDVTLYADWIPRNDTPYTVQHYMQDTSLIGYTLHETDSLPGATGSTAAAAANTYTGFHEATAHPDRVPSGTVAPDGSLVLALYYDRSEYTATFDSNGGSVVEPIRVVYGLAFGPLPTPVWTDYTFAGWYTDPVNGVKITSGTILDAPGNLVLTAHWVPDRYGVVDGEVIGGDGSPITGADVAIRAGSVDYLVTTTDLNGRFVIRDVKYGTYNLVASKDGIVVTTAITLSGPELHITVVLPDTKTNSIVTVSEDVPEIVIGGLHDLFNQSGIYTPENAMITAGGGEVALRLAVTAAEADRVITSTVSGQHIVSLYLDVTIQKEVIPNGGEASVEPLTELPQLVKILIPMTDVWKRASSLHVYRLHDGTVDVITTEPNEYGEYLLVDDALLVIHALRFSTYAVAYPAPQGNDTHRIIVRAGDGGHITPGTVRVPDGHSQSFEIAADAGYKIADVLADGVSVGRVSNHTFSRVRTQHSIEAVFAPRLSAEYGDLEEDSWYSDAVEWALEEGLMIGTDKGWEPYRLVDRAQAVMVLSRLARAELAEHADTTYHDVPSFAWYTPVIAWGTETGTAIGYGNGSFGPEDVITREQAALMLYRYTDALPADRRGYGASEWAADAFAWAVAEGILQGDELGSLNPQGSITRAELAVILWRWIYV